MPYVKGHYCDGHWVRPHYRRSPRGRNRVPSQRTRKNNRSKRPSRRGSSFTAVSPTVKVWGGQSGYRTERRLTRKKERDQIKETAEFCAAAIKDGAMKATADRIASHVSHDAWETLQRRWNRFRCKWLARLAQQILDTKSRIHTTVADVAMLKWWAPLHTPERIFAHELIKCIPLPGDKQFIAAAYSLRLTGVCLCAMQGIPLHKCACFRPLAQEYTKEQLKSILVSKGTEWMHGSRLT